MQLFRHFDPVLIAQLLYGFHEWDLVIILDESDNVTLLPASETVEDLSLLVHHK